MLNAPLATTVPPASSGSDRDGEYNPDGLLNNIALQLKADDDIALGRILEVSQLLLARIRHRKMRVGATLLLRLHEVSGRSMQELRRMLGDRRKQYRVERPGHQEG